MVYSKEESLEAIRQSILDNNVCPELKASATQLVFESGNSDAQLLFIGEAPGKQEDEQGLPFVGASGRLLDEMLESINLKRSEVYITNIVKYRPPNNRDPLPQEKQAFLPYLQAQIEVIQPKLVIPLGRHSLNCFLPDLQISKVHGQLRFQEEIVFLPLYHPAVALYNGKMRKILMEDFSKIPEYINQFNKENNKEKNNDSR